MKITTTTGAAITLIEAVAGALNNKEFFLVSLDAAGKAVLFDDTKPAFAVMESRLELTDGQINAKMLGKAGTIKVVQAGAIAPGTRVKGDANGRVVAADAGSRSIGIKLDRPGIGNGAAGDVIEIGDVIEHPKIATAVAAPAALTSTDGIAAAAADLAALKAEAELIGDDVRALHATVTALRTALVTQKIVS